jgi:hypothetical protein
MKELVLSTHCPFPVWTEAAPTTTVPLDRIARQKGCGLDSPRKGLTGSRPVARSAICRTRTCYI